MQASPVSETRRLAALKAERASLAAQGRRLEIETAPIRYWSSWSAPTPTANGPSGG
jgi:hypothetical protein